MEQNKSELMLKLEKNEESIKQLITKIPDIFLVYQNVVKNNDSEIQQPSSDDQMFEQQSEDKKSELELEAKLNQYQKQISEVEI